MVKKNHRAIKDILEEMLGQKIGRYANFPCLEDMELSPSEKANLTYDEVFAMNLMTKSLMGDMKATTELLDRVYGKAQQNISLEAKVVTYDNFLEDLAIKEGLVIDLPQTPEQSGPADGGSAGTDLLEDLGLYDN